VQDKSAGTAFLGAWRAPGALLAIRHSSGARLKIIAHFDCENGPVQLGGTFFRAGEYFRDMRIIGSGARIALPVGRIGLS